MLPPKRPQKHRQLTRWLNQKKLLQKPQRQKRKRTLLKNHRSNLRLKKLSKNLLPPNLRLKSQHLLSSPLLQMGLRLKNLLLPRSRPLLRLKPKNLHHRRRPQLKNLPLQNRLLLRM
jgi:hypothetical protein